MRIAWTAVGGGLVGRFAGAGGGRRVLVRRLRLGRALTAWWLGAWCVAPQPGGGEDAEQRLAAARRIAATGPPGGGRRTRPSCGSADASRSRSLPSPGPAALWVSQRSPATYMNTWSALGVQRDPAAGAGLPEGLERARRGVVGHRQQAGAVQEVLDAARAVVGGGDLGQRSAVAAADLVRLADDLVARGDDLLDGGAARRPARRRARSGAAGRARRWSSGRPRAAVGAHVPGSWAAAVRRDQRRRRGASLWPEDVAGAGRRRARDLHRARPQAVLVRDPEPRRPAPTTGRPPGAGRRSGRRRGRCRACRRSPSGSAQVIRSGVRYGRPPIAVAVWKLVPPELGVAVG